MREYKNKDVQRILRKNGWILHHIRGSHAIYKNEKNQHLTVTTGRCNGLIMQRLIKEYGMQVC